MTKFLNRSETLRSLVGAVAAMVIGGTILVGAVGPAAMVDGAARNGVNFASNSNIVGVA